MVIATVSDVVGFDFGKAKIERRPPWCWIDRDSDKFIMWELVTGLGWRIATIVFCTAVYSHIQFSLSVQVYISSVTNNCLLLMGVWGRISENSLCWKIIISPHPFLEIIIEHVPKSI